MIRPAAPLIATALAALVLALGGCGSQGDVAPAQTISVPYPAEASPPAAEVAPAAAIAKPVGSGGHSDGSRPPGQPRVEPLRAAAAPSTGAGHVSIPPQPGEPALAGPGRVAGAFPVASVRPGRQAVIRTEPGGGEAVARVGRTEFGSPSVFGVVERVGGWAGVTTAKLPNGRLGWIELDPRRVELGWTRHSIVVDVSARRAALLLDGREQLSFPVTVGAPGSATPVGRFAVTDTLTGLGSPAYGCCALAISATQPELPSGWLGGNRIAIHGTDGPLGTAASLGCVRADEAVVAELASRVSLGTPVFIRA